MLVQAHDVVAVTILALGLAFLLVWFGDRLNRAAFLWGLSHLALGVAALTGYRYQINGGSWLLGVSTVMTSAAIVTLWSGNNFLRGRPILARRVLTEIAGLSLLIAVVSFSGSQFVARFLVSLLFFILYAGSAIVFFRVLHHRWVAIAFALEAAVFFLNFFDGYDFSTVQQSLYITLAHWVSHLVLGLALVCLAAARSRHRLEQVIKHLPDAVVARRLDGTILFCNKAFAQLIGAPSSAAAVGLKAPLLSADRRQAASISKEINAIAQSGRMTEPVILEREIRPLQGEVFPAEITFSNFYDFGQTVILAQIRDLSERRKAEEKIQMLAYFDQLTGLPNRALLLDRLKQKMASCARSGSYGALLFIDLDDFRSLNDTLGHELGDILLRQTANRLASSVREGDSVGRLGGDEFVVILSGLGACERTAASGTRVFARKILAALGMPYTLGEASHQGTASVGVTLIRDTQIPLEDLLKQAELAMYNAKKAGRHKVHFFDPGLETKVRLRAALEQDLRRAIKSGQFTLHYQAQFEHERIFGAEVLIRWQHPERGMVSPAEFIPLAEETGLIVQLGDWVLETACARLALWSERSATRDLTIAVNVSVHQFHQADFVDQVLSALGRSGADPQRLKLELTESVLVHNIDDVIRKMDELRARGVGFALDDFGTGYSSLTYLKRLPIDVLKIDQSFVQDIMGNPNDAVIARSIIALAHGLGIGVIAEGVETEAQRDFLASSGCTSYQGFLLGRPLTVDAFEDFVQKHRALTAA